MLHPIKSNYTQASMPLPIWQYYELQNEGYAYCVVSELVSYLYCYYPRKASSYPICVIQSSCNFGGSFKNIFWQYFLNLFPGHYAAALFHLAAAHFILSSHAHYSLFIFIELHLASINLGTSNHVYKQNQGCICGNCEGG